MEFMSSHIQSIVFKAIALNHSNENETTLREADDGCSQSIDGAKLDPQQKTTEVTVQTSFTEHGTIENEKRTTIMQKRIKVHRCIVLKSGNGRVSDFDA